MYCPKCGTQNDDNNFSCTACSTILPAVQQSAMIRAGDNTLGGLIPHKNSQALISYYLGIFSLIPFLGSFLGIAAFVLGIKGLRFAKEQPASKGKIHAWVGILAGGFFGFGYFILTIILIGFSIFGK